MKTTIAQLSLLLVASTSAFTTTTPQTSRSFALKAQTSSDNEVGRRSFFFKTIATTASSLVALQPQKAFADVSDGNSLPQGALQFSRILKAKSDLASVTARVTNNGSEIDKKEWEAISVFLRKVYSAGDDMKFTAKGMVDYKKKASEGIIKDLQKLAIAGDIPAQNNDPEGFLIVAKRLTKLFDDFLDLLSDVPDEI